MGNHGEQTASVGAWEHEILGGIVDMKINIII